MGQLAFERACSICHSARDGFDLAYFSYADTTIIRRAVKHVDTATAQQIAAYIRTVNSPHVSQGLKLFQPGGGLVSSDVDFAITLFGQDAWPASLTAIGLLAINPLSVRIAVPLPVWSDEGSNLDWMPDDSLPAAILSYAGNAGASALAAYNASPTTQNLVGAVTALSNADRASANPGAPCVLFVAGRFNYEECFEVRRWISSLVAQHMLRNGITQSLGPEVNKIWWWVGDAARRSQGQAGQVPNARKNWAAWMYLGWMFNPADVTATYTAGGLTLSGLPRHATFVALRSMVALPPGSVVEGKTVYADFIEFAAAVPAPWATAATSFALRHILDRLNSGDRPPVGSATDLAISQINAGMSNIATKVSATDFAVLKTLADQVLAKL